MKKIIIASFASVCIFFVGTSSAQTYKTGLGIRLSSAPAMVNNSISVKHFLTDRSAIEALFSFGDPLSLGALYEIHKPFSAEGIQWYYGGGGYVGFVKEFDVNKNKNETNVNFGAQGVLGLDYKFVNIPLNLSLDWKPELNLVSDINFEPAAVGFTARFTF
jgi:hypothetical protein